LFFITEDEVVRERFSNAKMWFGLFIITWFLVLLFIGIIGGALFWGRPISTPEMLRWFTAPISYAGERGISFMSLTILVSFIVGGLYLHRPLTSTCLIRFLTFCS